MSLHRPQMLKDFLADDSNSCSSSGFRSFPRKPGEPTVRNLLELDLINTNRKAASTTTISAIHKASEIVFNAVKYLSFSSVKSPLVLPRSISRKLSKRRSWNNRGRNDDVQEVSVSVVKVKDILRWKSFRDLIEEQPPPLNFSSSPHRCTTTTTSTTESTSCSTSSWCDSDFTAEDLPSWPSYYDKDPQTGVSKKCLPEEGVEGDSTTVNTKGELSFEENEQQHSPVSVLNFPFQEDEEDCGDHDEYVEDNGLEENARRLMNLVKAASSSSSCEAHVDQLLLDFFMCELDTSRNQRTDDDESNCGMLRVAKDWMSGQYDESFQWEEESNREAYVRDMERGVRWSKFEEEQEELAMEMQAGLLNYLVDELVLDLSCSSKKE